MCQKCQMSSGLYSPINRMAQICLVFIKNMLNINLHHIKYCFNIVLPLFTHVNLGYVNINIHIFLFLNVAPSQNLVFAPGTSIRINTVFGFTITFKTIALNG